MTGVLDITSDQDCIEIYGNGRAYCERDEPQEDAQRMWSIDFAKDIRSWALGSKPRPPRHGNRFPWDGLTRRSEIMPVTICLPQRLALRHSCAVTDNTRSDANGAEVMGGLLSSGPDPPP